jgi:imidazolonepropionase-like amidohydrolase
MKKLAGLFLVAAFFQCIATAQTASGNSARQTPTPKITYILAGRLFDSTNESVKQTMVITVEGERIKSVDAAGSVKIPAGANVIDLSQATVLPGLIDCHTHLSARADRYNEIYRFKDTPFNHAFYAVDNARKTLQAGFTSVRTWALRHFLRSISEIRLMRASFPARGLSPADRPFRSRAVMVT